MGQLGADRGRQMVLNFPDRHPAGVEGDDHVIQPAQASGPLRDQPYCRPRGLDRTIGKLPVPGPISARRRRARRLLTAGPCASDSDGIATPSVRMGPVIVREDIVSRLQLPRS